MIVYKDNTPYMVEANTLYTSSMIMQLAVNFYSCDNWDKFFTADKKLEAVYLCTYNIKNNKASIIVDDRFDLLENKFNITIGELQTAIENRQILINNI